MQPREQKLSRGREDWLDEESKALLLRYREGRLASAPPPQLSSLRTEVKLLRLVPRASRSLGGPETLAAVLDDPDIIVRIVRGEWPCKHVTLLGILKAVLRLIDLTVDDREKARDLRERILGALHPRPTTRRRSQFLPRTVGGYTHLLRPRPVLTQLHLHQIVEAAGLVGPESEMAVRNQGLMAAISWSGMSSDEARTRTYEQVEPSTPTEQWPWCAMVHGIVRRGRVVSIPVHANAEPYLRALFEAAARDGKPLTGPLFTAFGKRGVPLSYSHLVRIRRAAVSRAGLPRCDDTTLNRAYTAYLKQCGLNEYAIRDALGLKLMATVDDRLKPHKRAASQRVAAEHRVIEPPVPMATDPTALQLELHLALDDGKKTPSDGDVRVLGVDPAYRRTGWAILGRGTDGGATLVACGSIVPEGRSRAEGLLSIETQFRDILRKCKPTEALFEKPGRWIHRQGSSRESIEVMAMARGTLLKACGELGVPASEVDFQQVRLALLGRANAGKSAAVELVQSLGLMPPPRERGRIDHDIVDAIMMALFGLD